MMIGQSNGEQISEGYRAFTADQFELFLICALSWLAGVLLIAVAWRFGLFGRRK